MFIFFVVHLERTTGSAPAYAPSDFVDHGDGPPVMDVPFQTAFQNPFCAEADIIREVILAYLMS